MKYKITLSTIASVTATVEAEDEDIALEKAVKSAREFSGQLHEGADWTADFNEEWQYGDPEIAEVA